MTFPPGPQGFDPRETRTWARARNKGAGAYVLYEWLRRPFELLDECAARYGETFSIRFPGTPTFVVFSNPDAVKEIFADGGEDMHGGKINILLRPFLGDHSVLMLDGKEHMRHRRILLPPFHGERMQAYGRPMLDATDDDLDSWPENKEFSLHGHLQAITLRIILRTVFGITEGPRMARMFELTTKVLEIASWPPLLLPFMQKDLGPLSPWGRFKRVKAAGDAILFDEINERRKDPSSRGTDILSLLLEARDEDGRAMSDDELRDELTTLLVAGHETTATALAWAMRWILDTPAIAERMREELAAAEQQGPLTPERIGKLELLDAVVRESLRLQPVIPMVGRILQHRTRVAGLDLPAGTGVLCSIYLAQRRAAAYPDPQRFDPDRFMKKKFSPNEFFPFGGGIRRCIGMAFAVYEMKMVLARVMLRTRMRLAPGTPIRVVRRSITLTPSDGLRVILDKRMPRRPSLAN